MALIKLWYSLRLFLCLVVFISLSVHANSNATDLFERLKQSVYQVRVIDIASGDKFSIGSGFLISTKGFVGTNFHVVSSYVHEPKKYRLELVVDSGEVFPVQLKAIDVVHDLAIIQFDQVSNEDVPLSLVSNDMSKGDRVYSMGNPQDLGMLIIEGTYSGLIQISRYQKILFSGSLNPGMSGGPALNAAGEVVGVNVSKGGEQISFLVPVKYLIPLLDQASNQQEEVNFTAEIGQSLFDDQNAFYQTIFSKPFPVEAFTELMLPGKLSESLKCWGYTEDEKEWKHKEVHQHCRTEDEIYIDSDLYVGSFFYDYEWITSEQLNSLQFYNLLQENFEHRFFRNAYRKEDISGFECHSDFLTLVGHSWKASSCFRAYKKYSHLYDLQFVMISVDEKDKAILIKLGATGISRDNATRLLKNMLESVSWN